MTKTYQMTSLIEKVSCVNFLNLLLKSNRMTSRCNRKTRISGTRLLVLVSIEADLTLVRFMGLNDLMTEVKQDPTCFAGDETIENKVLKQVLALVEDKISEVKNQAVKW